MEQHRFDQITRLTALSRRGVVSSVLGGVAAVITGVAVLEAKPGGNGKSNGQGQEKHTGKQSTKAKGKVWLCHQPQPITDPTSGLVLDATRRRGTVIQVAASAKGGPNPRNKLRGHLGHGDGVCPELPGAIYLKGTPCEVAVGVTGEVTTRWCTMEPTVPPA